MNLVNVTLVTEDLKWSNAHKSIPLHSEFIFQTLNTNLRSNMASFGAIASESLSDLVSNSGSVEPDVDINRVHSYKLNDKAVKGKLTKGAKREPFEVIKNNGSSNLDFSLGAWNYVVLPTVRYWNNVKDDKTCKVDKAVIKIASVELGMEADGKHVDSKVIFYVDKDKVVCHLYNTTQRILVNGNGYENLIMIFLEPYFQAKISQNIRNIEHFNKQALISLSGKRKAVTRPMRSVRYKPMVRPSCNQCDESFVNKSLLGAHTKSTHKKHARNGPAVFTPPPSIPDMSLMDLSVHNFENEVELEETCSIESHVCDKCTGVFGTKDELKVHKETEHKEIKDSIIYNGIRCDKCLNVFVTEEELEDHHEKKHSQKEPIIYNCGKCEQKYFTFSRLAEHIDLEHNPKDVEMEPLKSCDRCDFSTENDGDLKDHIVQDIHNIQDQNKSISSNNGKTDSKYIPQSEIATKKKKGVSYNQPQIMTTKHWKISISHLRIV